MVGFEWFLLKRKENLFDDKSTEINQLTSSNKIDIMSVNAEMEEVEVLLVIYTECVGTSYKCINTLQHRVENMTKVS